MSSVRTDGTDSTAGTTTGTERPAAPARSTGSARLAAAWTFVGLPLAYGVYETVKKASALF